MISVKRPDLSPGQTIATCQSNMLQHCWAQPLGHPVATCRYTSQHGGQTHTACCAQQCCDMLRWHVGIVWPGLKNPVSLSYLRHQCHLAQSSCSSPNVRSLGLARQFQDAISWCMWSEMYRAFSHDGCLTVVQKKKKNEKAAMLLNQTHFFPLCKHFLLPVYTDHVSENVPCSRLKVVLRVALCWPHPLINRKKDQQPRTAV